MRPRTIKIEIGSCVGGTVEEVGRGVQVPARVQSTGMARMLGMGMGMAVGREGASRKYLK